MNLDPFRFVLDTNIVLDCLVFKDPGVRRLMTVLEARRVQALVHPLTLDELKRVLAYPQFRLKPTEQQQVLDHYLGLATLAAMPEGFSRETLLLPTDFPAVEIAMTNRFSPSPTTRVRRESSPKTR